MRALAEWLSVATSDQKRGAPFAGSFLFDAELRMQPWPKPAQTLQIKAAVTRNEKGRCQRVTLMLPEEG